MLEPISSPLDDFTGPTELDVNRRRSLGIYYTPKSAAALLAKWAIRQSTDKVLEPSFGGCTILEAAINRLRTLGTTRPATQLFGFDVDDAAFGHLNKLLGKRLQEHFILLDFLTAKPAVPVDAVIANPPFVSYHRMNEGQRDVIRTWRSHNAPPFSMTASLWAYFLVHSLSFLKQGGRLAFVLPLAAHSSDYSQPLLTMLQTKFHKLALYRMREQLFIQAGAEERTIILLAEGYLNADINNPHRTDHLVANIQELDELLLGTSPLPGPTSNDRAVALLRRGLAENSLCRLGSVLDVKIGEVVGDTRFFVRSADEWGALRMHPKHLRPIVTRMQQVPGIQLSKRETASLYSAIPRLLSLNGATPTKAVQRYLDGYSSSLRQNNNTFTKRSPWYAVSYDATASAFIGSMAHESPRIVWNSVKVSCANGLYKLYRRKGTRWGRLLAAVSFTTPFRLSAELLGRVRGSGVLKLEPSDVAKLLIPSRVPVFDEATTRALLKQIDALARNGEFESASQVADRAFFPVGGIYRQEELSVLRDVAQDLRRQRLPGRSR